MRQIQDIYSVVNQISEAVNAQTIQAEVQNLTKLRQTFQANQQTAIPQAMTAIDKIISLVTKVNSALWTADHEYVADKLEIGNLIGEKGRRYFEDIKKQLQTNPASGTNILQTVIAEINKLRTKPTQFLTLLQPFELSSNIKLINETEGIIEITFDGNVAIDDFKEAKVQMNDWFLIIEGYARLLDVRREDFEIISITKSSPAKFKIKTSIKNATLVLGIVSSLLLIEKTVLENRLMIEKLKQNNLVPDTEIQKRFIEDAEKHIEEKIKDGIDKLVEQKIKEHNVQEGNGDIKNNLSKGIENQYNFIINGGNVNIHVIDGQISKQVDALEKTKEELKQIKQAYEDQKAITTGETKDTTNNE